MSKSENRSRLYILILTLFLITFFSKTIVFSGTEAGDFVLEDSNVKVSNESNGNQNLEHVPGEIIIKFKERKNVSSINALSKKHNAKVEKAFEKNGISNRIYKVSFSEGKSVKDVIDDYKKDPNIEYAQPNYIYKPSVTLDDTYFGDLWGLTKIQAPTAWDTTTGSSDITVAVVDSGIDYNHNDLASNIWINSGEIQGNGIDDDNNGYVDDYQGWDFIDSDNDPLDDCDHGTHVAGTIAAVGNNNLGVVGVTWNSKVMNLKSLSSYGTADCYGSSLKGASAITYATENGADIINASWGAANISDAALQDAIDYAHNNGVLVVAAAGNENSDVYSYTPANMNNVVAIAATDSSDAKASFSNYGSSVDVSAPGKSILSTISSNSYTYYSGTSMAAPHVSGLAALLLANSPSLVNEELRQVLKKSSIDLGTSGWDKNFGAGRIDAPGALSQGSNILKAHISSPDLKAYKTGPIAITGTAAGINFQNYTLEYGSGSDPSSWIEIANSNVAVTSNALGSLDTSSLGTGTYTLKLTATDTSANTFEHKSYVHVTGGIKKITSFIFDDLSLDMPIQGIISEDTHTITAELPYGTDLTSLAVSIDISGSSVSPASGVAQDFTNPVTYTVTADDGTTQDYIVTATIKPIITNFTFSDFGVFGTINDADHTISLTVPYGTDVTGLVPTIEHAGVSVSPDSGVAQDFSSPVTYTTTGEDSQTLDYVVTVAVAEASSAKAITAFSFDNLSVSGSIDESNKTISATVPYSTDVTSLTPTITHSGASISPASGVAQDFTNPVTYTVTAEDSTTQNYTVTITVALNPAKAVTAFSFSSLSVSGSIDESNKTISATVPYGTDVTSLTPTITHTGASISPASGSAQDFTNSITYTVTAEDGSTQGYTVTVTISPAPEPEPSPSPSPSPFPTPTTLSTTTTITSTSTDLNPSFSLEGGKYPSKRNMLLTAPEGAFIYYTLDGSIPTTDSLQYTGVIKITSDTIFKAIAVKNNQSSEVITQVYGIASKKNKKLYDKYRKYRKDKNDYKIVKKLRRKDWKEFIQMRLDYKYVKKMKKENRAYYEIMNVTYKAHRRLPEWHKNLLPYSIRDKFNKFKHYKKYNDYNGYRKYRKYRKKVWGY